MCSHLSEALFGGHITDFRGYLYTFYLKYDIDLGVPEIIKMYVCVPATQLDFTSEQ